MWEEGHMAQDCLEKGKLNQIKCIYCGKPGHTEDKCWQKHLELNPFLKSNKGTNTSRASINEDMYEVLVTSIGIEKVPI